MKTTTLTLIMLSFFVNFTYAKSDARKRLLTSKKAIFSEFKTNSNYTFSYKGKKYIYKIEDNFNGINTIFGKVIIPQKFDFIVFPGETYSGIVEVCKNKKYGLYSFPEGKEILPPVYDAFYPVSDKNILAYYKKGKSYGYILKKGTTDNQKYKKYKLSPFNNGEAKKWKIKIPTQTYMNKPDETCFYFVPSFLQNFFLDTIQDGFPFDGSIAWQKFSFSVVGTLSENKKELQIVKKITIGDMWSDDVTFFACNSDFTEKFYKTTINNFARLYYTDGNGKIKSGFEFKILNNKMCRIKNSPEFVSKKRDYPKTTLPEYRYFTIKKGKIIELKSNRIFPFTKYEKITPKFFKGYFIKEISAPGAYPLVLNIYKHLSIKDLDVMRNEIFADYGYSFKTKKWQTFFGKFGWYKPRFDNVDDKLSEIEKANVDVILRVKAKLKKDEKKYRNPKKANRNDAG